MNCRLTDQVFQVIRSLQEEQKRPKDYGTGQLLYQAEVEFLNTVYSSPQSKVSELSETLGITKGAVTQLAGKLMGKGLIEQYQRPGNKKEKFFRLTPEGEAARAGYERFHREANNRLCGYFCSLEDDQLEIISAFLEQLKDCVPFTQFQCSGTHTEEMERT